MKKNTRKMVLEPKEYFSDIFSFISWQKVLVFIMVIIFFANVGIFIYKKNKEYKVEELNLSQYSVNNPYNEENSFEYNLPFGSGLATHTANIIESDPDIEGVFEEKTANTDSVAPVARIKLITNSLTEGFFEGDAIFLSAIDSYDPDGKITEYRWDFDQSNGLNIDANGVTATAQYNTSGVYTITLTVIDSAGLENSTSLSLTVQKKPNEKPNLLGITTSLIDFDDLDYSSRAEIKNASEKSYAMFYASATSNMAQAIYNNQNKALPALPSLTDIELSVKKDYSSSQIVVDSVIPKDGSKIYTTKPIITATFIGENETDIESIELIIDGKSVTQETSRMQYGVNYTPSEDLSYGTHNVSLMVSDVAEQRTVKSWSFTIANKTEELAGEVKEYKDEEGPQLTMKIPDINAKNVKPNSSIKLSFNEPVDINTFQLAVTNKTTNISKLFAGSEVEWSASKTNVVITPKNNIFEYDNSYQLIAKQKDELGNESIHEWMITCEEYAPPEITITSPKDKTVFSHPDITVKGYADPTYLVFVGDTTAVVDSKGAFSADISLQMGENNIEITVKDLLGKKSTSYITLTYDPYANEGNPVIAPQDSPVIMDASIRDGEVIDMVRPQISFVYADSDDIDTETVLLKLDDKDVTEFSFVTRDSITYKPLEELTEGEHYIYFVVADKLGNRTRYEMKFTVSAYPDKPEALTARLSSNNKKVLLLWDMISNIQAPEYRIYRSIDENVLSTSAAYEVGRTSGTSFEDDTVLDGVTYYYVVAAVSDDEILSNQSNMVKIRVDWTAPEFQITAPEKTEETNHQSYLLKGIVNADDVKEIIITLNNKEYDRPEIQHDNTFSSELILSPGENVIQILVVDNDGNENVETRLLTYNPPDIERPYVTWLSPKGTDVDVTSNIVIKYNEKMDKNNIQLFIKDVKNPDNVIPITINNIELQISDDLTTFTYNPSTDLEYDVEYEVIIKAHDLEGNESLDDDWNFRTAKKEAPILEVTTPVEGAVYDNPTIFVSGKTENGITVSIFINGKKVEPDTISIANGLFSTMVTLDDYDNIVTVVATDRFNNATTIVRNVYYNAPDVIPPDVLVSSPTTGIVLGTNTTNIQGRTDPSATVTITVNGVDQGTVSVNESGFFNHQITLQPGVNLIRVDSTDSAGNVTTKTISITYDNVGPLIAIANPPDGFTTNLTRVEIRGNVEKRDYQSYTTMYCTVNGDPQIDILVTEDGRFNQFVNLSNGVNHIIVVATDSYGNTTTREMNVYVDLPGPTGTLQQATTNGSTGSSTFALVKPETETTNTYSVNNTKIGTTFDLRNNSSSQLLSTEYPNGNSGSTTAVIDPSRNERTYWGGDNSAPEFSVNSSNGLVTNNPNNILYGTTEPEVDVMITQNGQTKYDGKASSSNGSFNASVELKEGHNVFTTSVTDSSGNISFSNTVVELDTKGPNTTVLSPNYNEKIGNNKYLIKVSTEPNTSVEVAIGENGIYSVKTPSNLTSDETGLFRTEIEIDGNDEGNKTLRVVTTDKLGNKTTKTVPIIVDVTAPTITNVYIEETFSTDPIILVKNGVVQNKPIEEGILQNGAMISSSIPYISGTTEPNCTVQLLLSGTEVLGAGKSDESGNFKFKIATLQGNNLSNLAFKSIDEFGNESKINFNIMVDSIPPEITIIEPSGVSKSAISTGAATSADYVDANITITTKDGADIVENNVPQVSDGKIVEETKVSKTKYNELDKLVTISSIPVESKRIVFDIFDHTETVKWTIYINNSKALEKNNYELDLVKNKGYKTTIDTDDFSSYNISNFQQGINQVKIVVTDKVGNTSTKEVSLLYYKKDIDETINTLEIDRTLSIDFDTFDILKEKREEWFELDPVTGKYKPRFTISPLAQPSFGTITHGTDKVTIADDNGIVGAVDDFEHFNDIPDGMSEEDIKTHAFNVSDLITDHIGDQLDDKKKEVSDTLDTIKNKIEANT